MIHHATLEKASKECKDDKYGQKGKYYDYQIKDAADCLVSAESIKKDKEMMSFVSKCLDEEYKSTKKAISSIQDLRDIVNKRSDDDD